MSSEDQARVQAEIRDILRELLEMQKTASDMTRDQWAKYHEHQQRAFDEQMSNAQTYKELAKRQRSMIQIYLSLLIAVAVLGLMAMSMHLTGTIKAGFKALGIPEFKLPPTGPKSE